MTAEGITVAFLAHAFVMAVVMLLFRNRDENGL